jgi:hypothetical protein
VRTRKPSIAGRLRVISLLLAATLAGCEKTDGPVPVASTTTETKTADAVQACKLVTLDEIVALAGGPLEAIADEGVGRTGCVWEPAGGGLPRLELKIEWGMADVALTATGVLEKHEPGISSPYDDLGDEAVVIGPVVMIKRDEDLVTITVSGIDEADAAVRTIYETATARM